MSRSNPTDNAPHPCTRWIEWDGSNGGYRYYDKAIKENVVIGDNLTFILLDQLATINGWHDASESGIFSNEVRDIVQDTLVVKAFKGGVLAEGPYKQIRDRIISHGGHFTANLYVAVKIDSMLAIASIQFKGAALSSWMEFGKKNRGDLYKKAIKSKGFEEGKKGKITFRTPLFSLVDINPETNAQAIECDRVLQEFLASYFRRTKTDQVAKPPADAQEKYADDEELAAQDKARRDYEDKQHPHMTRGNSFADMDDDIPF